MKRKAAMPGTVSVRSLVSDPGVSLGYAKKLGGDLERSNDLSRVRIFNGHIIRATKTASGDVIVTILEPPGIWAFSAQFFQSSHEDLPSGFVDGFVAETLFYDAGIFSKAIKPLRGDEETPVFSIEKVSAQTGRRTFFFC